MLQLGPAHRAELAAILTAAGVDFAPHRPVVFGSRAEGTARRYSDIDLGLAGEPLPFEQLGRLSEALEDSELPYRVDVVNLAELSRESRALALARAAAFLAKALDTEASDIQQAATIQAFEFWFELSWKLLKERLREEGIEAATPKAVLRTAGDAGMIDSVEGWLG